MKIDGRLIAENIKSLLKEKITILRQKDVIPQLAVVLIGNDPGSITYVKQKQKVGEELGVQVSLFLLDQSQKSFNLIPRLKKLIKELNNNPSVHGIIIQRPVPVDIGKEELDLLVVPQKDVDGFHPKSTFTPPIASAVIKIFEWIYNSGKDTSDGVRMHSSEVEEFNKNFINWLKNQKILVIGRGETAGKPIAKTLKNLGVKITVAHSKTNNFKELCLASNIIISCAGKPNIVRHDMISNKTVLIGIGLHQEKGKLKTDYDQEKIADNAVFYTPVPGGVGPVNVACLFENLVFACKLLKKLK